MRLLGLPLSLSPSPEVEAAAEARRGAVDSEEREAVHAHLALRAAMGGAATPHSGGHGSVALEGSGRTVRFIVKGLAPQLVVQARVLFYPRLPSGWRHGSGWQLVSKQKVRRCCR